tara:strand:- start:2369 stop:2743 length:375 start_codon:yes stop_codon:yes gene_type:complete
MSLSFENLSEKVVAWANEKGIIDSSNPIKQLSKTQEELDETLYALRKIEDLEENGQFEFLDKEELKLKYMEEVKDGIGDMLVTIIILAELNNLRSEDCLDYAYQEIKNRKGKMVDGLFVKEQNL